MHTLAKKNRVIEQLIQLAHLVRTRGCTADKPLALIDVIRSQCCASTFEEMGGNLSDAVDVFMNADVLELVGWLSGYAELAGYETEIDEQRRGDIEAMLKDLGLGPNGLDSTFYKIHTGEIDHVGDDWPSDEPAPAKVYLAIKESLQLTTRARLDAQSKYRRDDEPGLHILTEDHDVLDEYARQASQVVIGLLNL